MQIRSLLRVAAQLTDEVAVVEDVVVREGGALGETRCAGGVLDVDRVARLELGLHHGQPLGAHLVGAGQQVAPRLLADDHDLLQLGALVARRVDHGDVVRRLELRRDDHHPDAGLAQHVGQLVRAVRRVDVDQDRADLRRRVLGQHPLRAVRRPDADPVTLGDAGTDQPAREAVDLGTQLGVRHPDAARAVDERVALGHPGHRRVEVVTDGLLEEQRLARSDGVREGGVGCLGGHRGPSGCGDGRAPANTPNGAAATVRARRSRPGCGGSGRAVRNGHPPPRAGGGRWPLGASGGPARALVNRRKIAGEEGW